MAEDDKHLHLVGRGERWATPGDVLPDAPPGDDLDGVELLPPVERREEETLTKVAHQGIRALLALMGEDPWREGLLDTPARVVKAYLEMAERPGDPGHLLSTVFHDVSGPEGEMIAVGPIQFVSLCEHHLLPFTGTAWVAYIPAPQGGVVGLSKIPRLVQHYARRPQVQERLTNQIVEALEEHLTPMGSACLVSSTHACMSLRGVRQVGAEMVTSSLRGRFLTHPATRQEFLTLARP